MIKKEEHAAIVAAVTTEDDEDPAAPEKVDRVRASAAQTGSSAAQTGSSAAQMGDGASKAGGAGFSLSRLIQQAAARKRLEQEDDPLPPAGSVPKVVASPRAVIMNEWEAYKVAEVTEETVDRLGGPLAWWRQNEMLYPHIAKLARKYLAVQASSAASERLFSQAGLVVTSNRNRLSGETAADIIFLHESIKHKLW